MSVYSGPHAGEDSIGPVDSSDSVSDGESGSTQYPTSLLSPSHQLQRFSKVSADSFVYFSLYFVFSLLFLDYITVL